MESFVSYKSFHDALKELPMEEYGKVMYAINEYALNDNEIELNGVAKIAFTLIKPQLDANKRRKEAGTKGGRPAENKKPMVSENSENEKPMVIENEENKKPMVSEIGTEKKPNVNVNVNVNENENEADNGLKPDAPAKKTHFVKPSLSEIQQYCQENNYVINAEAFYNYYESNGWKIGGRTAMKNWKAAIQSWTAREKKSGTLWRNNSSDSEVKQYEDMF